MKKGEKKVGLYSLQSVQSTALTTSKLSRRRTALKRCTNYRDPLIQKVCLSTPVQRNPPSKVIKEVATWCVEYARGLYRNWFKDNGDRS